MLLQFENINTLKTFMLGGFIPQDVLQDSCKFGFDGENLIVQTERSMDSETRDRLRSLGVKGSRKSSLLTQTSPNWIEILPIEKDSIEPEINTTILFQMNREQMIPFVQDFVGQGHLSQQYAFYEDKVLCRVVEPPYYLVLKYLSKEDVTLFHEIPNSGVWVQRGFSHPLQTFFRPEKNMILIPETGGWVHLPFLEWKEVFDYTNFTIENFSFLQKEEGLAKIDIPLSLLKGKSTKPDVFWVLRKEPLDQIESFLKNLSDEEVDKFSFSVCHDEDKNPLVLLKARNQNHPPTINLNAECYIVSSVPWLYIPTDSHINPPLRPSALSNLLFEEDKLVWFAPIETEGRKISFQVEKIEDNFLPLNQWVQYVITESADSLKEWVESSVFEFDSFVDIGCEWKSKPKSKKQKETLVVNDEPPPPDSGPSFFTPSLPTVSAEVTPVEIFLPQMEPSEQELHFQSLTEEFVKMEVSWEDPSRVSKWIEIGNLYAGMKNEYQAILCWSRALWIAKDQDEILVSWENFLRSQYNFSNVEDILNKESHSLLEVIFICVWILRQERIEDLEIFQSFLQIHQKTLDQRLLWKVSKALSKLSGGDNLLLASTYDIILENNSSISIRELPSFIRSQSNVSSLNFIQETLERYLQIYLSTDRNYSVTEKNTLSNLKMERNNLVDAQIRLMFALALARTGQRNRAMEEVTLAEQVLLNLPPEATENQRAFEKVFFNAFSEKIEEALNGHPIKDFSSEIKSEIADLIPSTAFHWHAAMKSLSLFPNPFGDNQTMWILFNNQESLGFTVNKVSFGKDTELEIQRILNWVQPKIKSTPPSITPSQLKGIWFYLIYLCNSIDSRLIPSYLTQIYNLVDQTPTYLSHLITPIIKVCQRFELDEFLLHSVSLSSQDFETELYLEKQKNGEYLGDLPEYVSGLFLLGPKLNDPSFEKEVNRWQSYYDSKQEVIAQFRQRINEMREVVSETEEERNKITQRINIFQKKILDLEIGTFGVKLCLSFLDSVKNKSDKKLLSDLSYVFEVLPQQVTAFTQNIILCKILQTICKYSSTEVVSFITSNLLKKLPTTFDNMSSCSYTSLSVLSLMEGVIFSLVSDNLIFSDQVVAWSDEDEKILFKGIQESLRG